jgi:ADP-heptose:LPS heptosyltransferase
MAAMPQHQRVLVIRRRYLGDVVLLGSLFRNLRLHWPGAHLAALVEPAYAGILALNPDVDEAMALPGGLSAWPGFLARLRRVGFTHVLDLDNTEKTALIARLSGAAFRVALHHGAHPVRLRGLYSDVAYEPASVHENQPISEYYLSALRPAGVPVSTREVRLVPRESEVADWRRIVGAQGMTLLVHPGSRSPSRIWPAERFAAVCDRVQDELGVQVVLVGGASERGLLAGIRGKAKTHVLSIVEPPTLPLLAALARSCSALLCHDSGPMHVAAAVGTPVVALYGSQNPVLFRPHGAGHTQLAPTLPCTPCAEPAACVPGDSYRTYCVRRLTVDQVFAALKATLSRASSG